MEPYPRQRTRQDGQTVTMTWLQERFQKTTCTAVGSWGTTATGNVSRKVGTYRAMSDWVTPGFDRKSARGSVFFSPMRSVTATFDAGYGAGGAIIRPLSQTCASPNNYWADWRHSATAGSEGRMFLPGSSGPYFDAAGFPIMPPTTMAEVYPNLLTEASTAARASVGTPTSQRWEDIAELSKSLAIPKDIVDQMHQFLKSKPSVFRTAKSAGNAWLLYRYGFTPIMRSFAEVTEGLSKQIDRRRQTSRGFASASNTSTQTAIDLRPYANYSIDAVTTDVESIEVRAMSLHEYTATLASNIGFSAKGLLALPWELVPYSFVIDWFANVGQFYQSLLPVFGYDALGSCVVVRRRIDRSVRSTNPRNLLTGTYTMPTAPAECGYTASFEEITRTIGLKAPGLVVKQNFGFDSAKRVADSLSLFIQRIK